MSDYQNHEWQSVDPVLTPEEQVRHYAHIADVDGE
jgi:hypothetical protein